MNLKDRLRHVFKETFLDLFQEDTPSSQTIEDALVQARTSAGEATDALAAFTVTDLHLREEHLNFVKQATALEQQLETALTADDDDLARTLIRKQQVVKKELGLLDHRIEESNRRLLDLKERVEAMKAQVLEIERKKLELQLRERAAESIDKVSQLESSVDEARGFATGAEAETDALRKEAVVEVSDEERNTLDSRLNSLLEEDGVEQELARLKQQRKQ